MVTINHLVASTIRKTEDPTAPIKFEELHKWCDAVGKMLVHISDKEKVIKIGERLLKDFSEEETNTTAATPEFTVALSSLLMTAVELLTRKMADDPSLRN